VKSWKVEFAIGFAFAACQTLGSPSIASLPAKDRMLSCDREIAVAAAREELESSRNMKEPLSWFMPALTLYRNDERKDALFWFYAAQLRTRYELVFEGGDRGQLLSVMLMTVGGPINNFGFQNPDLLLATFERVLKWDAATPNPWRTDEQNPDQRARVAKIYDGFEVLKQKVLSERETLKEQSARYASVYEQTDAQRCRPGHIDPSLLEQARQEEQRKVESWIRKQPEVLQSLGRVSSASVSSSALNSGDDFPISYEVYVQGESELFVDVDVDHTKSTPEFHITCASTVPFGKREPKAKCPQ
jgi:hypothetical protein